ncbi:MAG TPA: polyprenol monophosphomannose synthase [Phycisphaerae bacterium]|nr:polyprenol monophosphomannose synthase [Phycisphaerae bacterium]
MAAVSIVVPTYKEAENIPILTGRIFDAFRGSEFSAELIFVDDNSRDGTVEAVEKLAQSLPVRLITRTNERGLSSAVIRGFEEAKNDILLCMDADLSHPPESIAALIAPISSGKADFAIGSRYTAGGTTQEDWGFLRRLNSNVATALARPLTPVRDPMAGFFCLSRETWERARAAGLSPLGYKIGLEILIKARCRNVVEIPISFSDRLHGKSKLTLKQQLEYLRHLLRLYQFRFPLITSGLLLIALAGIVYFAFRTFLRR